MTETADKAGIPDWAVGIGAGLVSAVLFLSALSGNVLSVLLVYLAPLPLLIAGLGWGLNIALVAGAVGAAVLVLMTGLVGTVSYVLLHAAAPAVLTRQALLSRSVQQEDGEPDVEWYPTGQLMVWLAGLAITLLLTAHVAAAMAVPGGLPGLIRDSLPALMPDSSALVDALNDAGVNLTPEQLFDMVARVVPAAMAALWMLSMGGNVLLAQAIVRASKRNIRPNFDLARMALPALLAYGFIAALAASFAPGEFGFLAGTAAVILGVPFFITGLITIHLVSASWVARAPNGEVLRLFRPLMLMTVYFLLLVQGATAILVCILGLADQFMGLRRKALIPAAEKETD